MSRPPVMVTRRGMIRGGAIGAVGAVAVRADAAAQRPDADASFMSDVPVRMTVNGEDHEMKVEPRASLLDSLRERLGLTGVKKGCNRGECGACTVLLDGRRVNSCLISAAMVDGQEITTIEGLADGDKLHPVQKAFIEKDAFQCGYCTPGQIMSAVACIAEGHAGSNAEIREWMSGNICRCAAFPQIAEAVEAAAKEMA